MGSFHKLYKTVKAAASIDNTRCKYVAGVELPRKFEIKEIVQRVASKLGFDSQCQNNRQADKPVRKLRLKFSKQDDGNSPGKKPTELSPTQRFNVCDLRKKSETNSEIAQKLLVDEALVEEVRCKDEL